MIRIILIAAALASTIGVGLPLASSVFGGGDNEATRLVEAADRTQNKAQAVGESYGNVIPPAPNPVALPVRSEGPSRQSGLPGAPSPETAEPTPTVEVELTPGEHAVRDAMEFLNRVHLELNPSETEYIRAVEQLKQAWGPRYARAIDEYRRFDLRIKHAEEMAFEYLEIQQRLTTNIQNPEMRQRFEERDAIEQRVVLDWINQAKQILAQATMIKSNLDDMDINITKLELSATFSSVYEGFLRMPIAISMLNNELGRFQDESEKIYRTFGPRSN